MSSISAEDLARADYYAVLSRLFFAPPDETLLTTLADAGNVAEQGALPAAWNALCAAAGTSSAESAKEEYDALFVAIGKPRVVLYASWHLTGFMMEKPLAKLREDLAELGLARSADILEPEDHFAALMDIMRHLLLDAARRQHPPVVERRQHLAVGIHALGHFEPHLAVDQRRESAAQAVSLRARATAQLQHVAEALGGDQADLGDLAFEHRIRGRRRAVHDRLQQRRIVAEFLRGTLERDRRIVFDPRDGLYRGEQSFLDWREQTYPEWVGGNLVHIAMSKTLSTNVLHLRALEIAWHHEISRGSMDRASSAN